MSNFKTLLLVWISSILDHWGSVGTGGIIVLLIQACKDKWPRFANWQVSRRVLAAFLVFAMFQSWEVEYLSRLGRERDLIKAHSDNDDLQREIVFQGHTLGAKCDTKDAVNQTLEKQNRDEQVLIAGCQNQALKLISPPELKITTRYIGELENGAIHLVITNTPLTPFTVTATCKSEISEMRMAFLRPDMDAGTETIFRLGGGQRRVSSVVRRK